MPVIETADQYKAWFDAPESIERYRKLREPAPTKVWREVISRYPVCRSEVAWSPEAPLEVLQELRKDEDERVKWRVRTNARWLQFHPDDGEPWKDDPSLPIQLRLSDDERAVLSAGLLEWGGPARCTEELAVAMGFRGVEDLFTQGDQIREAIAAGTPLSRTDWTRALLATEVVFISNVVGSGHDWQTTTGLSDTRTLELIRALQRHLVTGGVVGEAFGTRPHGHPRA